MKPWTLDPAGNFYTISDCPLNCDGDGANGQTGGIACYVPLGSGLQHLDNLENAGHIGNWWGLACYTNGHPFVQQPNDPAPGAYVSTTAYVDTSKRVSDPHRYLDAAGVPFIVVPRLFIREVPGTVMGCYCEVEYQGEVVGAMVGDVGPDFGEFSLFLCKQFDPDASCHGTSINRGVTVRVYPGKQFKDYRLLPS